MLNLRLPITCLVTSGRTTQATTASSDEFQRLLRLVRAATTAGISLIQIREKQLTAAVLFALAEQSAAITRSTDTKLLVNDRADVAAAAGADGVQLTSLSIEPGAVRRAFGGDFLIGVSAHSAAEVEDARLQRADFAILGHVFETPSKIGKLPLGADRFGAIAAEKRGFPLIAIGGIDLANCERVFCAGASGIAAIRLFGDPATVADNLAVVCAAYEVSRLRFAE